ncbi:MAG TPA: arsenate reductase ArsC [Candidatus Eisenbacteria bacterium]|nr:arsenate reductase ArsC [Candidatus Eisenbacteria bacterium]
MTAETAAPVRVLFACIHNAGRSQMAAGFFAQLADPARAVALSAGTDPAPRVHPEVVVAMRECGVELAHRTPQRLTAERAAGVRWLVTMGCGEACPFVPGARIEDWALDDPAGRPPQEVRRIRDDIRARVAALVEREGWARR